MLANVVPTRVAVVFGNNKHNAGAVMHPSVNLRHWKSYEAVACTIADTLKTLGVDALAMPDGADLIERLRAERIGLVWLNTGGVQGESPVCHTSAALESAGVPYIGHTPLNAALLDDKGIFKLALGGLGLPTARFVIWNAAKNGRLHPETNRAFRRAFGSYSGPFIVKPVNGRASQNVEFVPSIDGLEAMVAQVFAATGCLILVEQYLGGREYCVAVAGGGPTGGGLAFSAVERVLGAGERVFTSMDVKAITGDRVRALDASPGSADAAVANQLFSLARAVYEDLSLTALVRLDIRADDKGRLHILEANPKPDLARPKAGSAVTSMVAAGLPALGWSYEDLIAFLLVERLWQLQTKRPEVLAHFMPAGSNGDELIRALPCRIASVLGATPAPAAPLEVRELRKALSAALVRASSLQLREEGAVEGAGRFSGGSFTGGGFPFARTCDLGAASFTYA